MTESMKQIIILVAVGLDILVVILAVVYFMRKMGADAKFKATQKLAEQIVTEAEKEAKVLKDGAILQAKEKMLEEKSKFERDCNERLSKISSTERRASDKESTITRKLEQVEKKEKDLVEKEKEVGKKEQKIAEKDQQLSITIDEQKQKLQQISGMTVDQAKKTLLSSLEDELKSDAAVLIRTVENETKEIADKKARQLILTAIQRCASEHTSEVTVSTVPIPSEEVKGKIIGREGRNIRALEAATGVTFIIDDTPESIVISGFDPLRREIGRVSLERLLADGRVHPARIEEVVAKTRKEIMEVVREAGKQAAMDVGVHGLHPELSAVLGRLHFRTSYGQNVLNHSKEVAWLAESIASELGLDASMIKRAALLHDVGKAVDHEIEGPHALIGAELAKKYRERPDVIAGIAVHHGEVPVQSIEAVIVQSADAISGARPGARRDTVEGYIKRLEKLEEIADSFPGVAKAFAMQAGREIRVIVQPEKIDDAGAVTLARNITKRIEDEVKYPGMIKVTVVRETRAVEYAT
jgi:ribonuclease Y